MAPGKRRRAGPAAGTLDAKAARVTAFDLLARKAWSRRDLAARLRRRGAAPEVAAEVVAELETKRYLDDDAFARWWAEARARGRRVGSVRLRGELRARGIPAALAAAAVDSAFAEVSERERALEAGRRRLAVIMRGPAERRFARLRDYLLRRGYPAPAALSVVTELLGPAVEE